MSEQVSSSFMLAMAIGGFECIFNVLREYMDKEGHWRIEGIVDKPTGIRQDSGCPLFEFEYCDQHNGCCGDNHYGNLYFPLPDDRFICVSFQC